jgi:hypothetical protein
LKKFDAGPEGFLLAQFIVWSVFRDKVLEAH